ncbi:sulfur carrier protein ThiS [Williamwhitmania taraxaci]|uniref:Thiazole synthase/sulfur carrier protein n=1 Tax=Williamwhitmania taraxaci TaxID=1640674 RepID=A0A1G6NAN2_9BACT|nr:sulfur carrier protein ThiS [Williamwhitmania taraxaci]SDC64346.1 thiazole synthase/sulfur carrier protein [Williamwhitmania taraxaci]
MEITVNHISEVIENRTTITISELLRYKNFTYKMIIIKLNGNVVKREEGDSIIVSHGDNVQVIHLMTGG